MNLRETVEAHITATLLATPAPRPKVLALGICDWPIPVYDAFMAQDFKAETHMVPENGGHARDGRPLSACGTAIDGPYMVAVEGSTASCIACAIASGVKPEAFLDHQAA